MQTGRLSMVLFSFSLLLLLFFSLAAAITLPRPFRSFQRFQDLLPSSAVSRHHHPPSAAAAAMPELGDLGSLFFGGKDSRHPPTGDALIPDVIAKERAINVFGGLTREVDPVSQRLEDANCNSTVLAPLNSAISGLPHKPWQNQGQYEALGADAYEGDDGRQRARENLRRFVEAHVIPVSPWKEGERVRTLLGAEVWWEKEEGEGAAESDDGKKMIRPDNVEVEKVASTSANGEIWVIKGVLGAKHK